MHPTRPPIRLAAARSPVEMALLWTISDPLEQDGLTALQRDCRVLFDVDAAVMNGGIGGLVLNHVGDLLPVAIDAAERLHVPEGAAVLRAVAGCFEGGYLATLAERETALGDEGPQWRVLGALADDWPSEQIALAIDTAVREHPSDFWSADDEDREAEALLALASALVGEGVWGNRALAEAALHDAASWAKRAQRDDDLRHVEAEIRRMRSLRGDGSPVFEVAIDGDRFRSFEVDRTVADEHRPLTPFQPGEILPVPRVRARRARGAAFMSVNLRQGFVATDEAVRFLRGTQGPELLVRPLGDEWPGLHYVQVMLRSSFLDLDECDWRGEPRQSSIFRYAVHRSVLDEMGHRLFKREDAPIATDYCTQQFVDTYERSGLTGLVFRPLHLLRRPTSGNTSNSTTSST